jgi:outer membrane protein
MMMKRLCLYLIAAALGLATAAPQAANLLELYEQARLSDPVYQAAAADLRARLEAKPQARSGLLPNVGFTGTISRDRFDPRGAPSNTSTTETYGLALRQSLFRRDRLLQLDQADYLVAQAEADYAAATQALVLRVSDAYFATLAAHDTLLFAAAEKNAITRQLDQAQQRFEVGLTAITDVHETQAAYDLAVSREIEAQAQLDNAYEALRELAGMRPQALAALSTDLPLVEPEPRSPDAWVDTALEQNLALVSAMAGLAVRQQEVRIQRAGHLPTLDLTAGYGYRDQALTSAGAQNIEREEGSIGLELNIPIYSGGLTSSRTREARARFQESQALVDGVRRNAERQVREAYRGVTADISQVRALDQALQSSRTALRAQEAGMEVGTRTTVDVLNAQRELFRAERDRAQARYTYLLNGLRLKQAAGILGPEDLAPINAYLQ